MEVIVGTVLGLLGLGLSAYVGRNSLRQLAERSSTRRFARVRRVLSSQGLAIRAAADPRLAITGDGWLLDQPAPLDHLDLRLASGPASTEVLAALKHFRRYLPVDATGARLDRYHEAVGMFDPPELWFNANTYLLLGITPEPGRLVLDVGRGRYWDCFDFAEGLRHEAAHHFLGSGGRALDGPFRKALGRPEDFTSRHCGLGFTTLTVRSGADGRTFFLHRRGGEVAVGQFETSLVPAGEFQPSDDSEYAFGHDLDLWRAMMREYAEELMDMAEHRQGGGAPIDYANQMPFSALQSARARGEVRPYLLGIGLDPVSWKAQIYTICVFDADVFDRLFAGMPTRNREGVFELPSHHRAAEQPLTGWPLTPAVLADYADQPTLSPSARLVLGLAGKHLDLLR